MTYPATRLRRLRRGQTLPELVRETSLQITDFIQPLFIKVGIDTPVPIISMPGCQQLPLELVADEVAELYQLGLRAVILFGIPANKDATGSAALDEQGIVQQAIRKIKAQTPDMLVIADCCFCEYTDHGHCGILAEEHEQMTVANDASLELLGAQAVSLAQAGADVIAPSGMLDGMVGVIRQALDQASFSHIAIMSYSVKYASSCYGPFREAAEGAPSFGTRQHYQMDPGNRLEAQREAEADIAEGTDFLMVKPAMFYLDIVRDLKQTFPTLPLVAYQVSGEYAMLKAAAQSGCLDEAKLIQESLLACKRAGADLIISYYAKEMAVAFSASAKNRESQIST